MTTLLRSTSLSMARAGLAVMVLSFTVFGMWTSGDLLGQAAQKKPRVEEEEDAPKAKTPPPKTRAEEKEDKPKAGTPPGKKKKHVEEEEDTSRNKPKKRKVIRIEEEEDPKTKSTTKPPSAPAASGDLNQLAEQATYPSIKKLFRSLAYPHDHAVYKRKPGVTINGEEGRREENIEPIPLYLGTNPSRHRRARIRFIPLTIDWQRDKPYAPIIESLDLVQPYEKIAQDAVRRFLKSEPDPEDAGAPHVPSKYEKLIAAEQVLSFVLNWHESARQAGKRSGEEWAAVEASLRKQLLDEVRLERMKLLAQAKDWDGVLKLAHQLADTYTDDAERERIFRPVAGMIKDALGDPTADEDKKQEARKRLLDLTREFPRSPAFKPIIDTLRSEAQSQLDAAKEALKDKDEQKARRYLKSARDTWPELPELGGFALELNREHPTLRVGVRGPLPRYFSPAWACTDNEHRAVDLLFESLVKLVPDGEGGFRYRPGLAESNPKVVPLGRQFELPRSARWSDGQPVLSTDIDFSTRLLRNGREVGRSRVWGDLLGSMRGGKDAFHVTLSLKQGFLDPLALMTFPILPRDQKVDVNSKEFAENPVTSGPYRLNGIHSDEASRECLFFAANPSYGLRAAKHNAPHIENIRLYTYTNAVDELRLDRLDLVLDLTAKEAQELLDRQRTDRLPVEVPMPSSAVPNRRIYFLAINNRKLPDANLRRALALAINREELLNKHFRAPLKTPVHRVLNGPFPAGSWACNPALNNRANKKGLDLFDPDTAKNLSVAAGKPDKLKLKYPQGDPVLKEAMTALCAQVKDLIEVVLEPLPCDPYQLREDVEETQEYDLAYYHYDFPDESYWLAPLLGPPPHASEDSTENMFRFTHPDLSKLLAGTEGFRNFTVVQQYQWQLHDLLDKQMPFIPLWQLDPLLAYRREVKPDGLDPCKVFSNIEEWRVQPR